MILIRRVIRYKKTVYLRLFISVFAAMELASIYIKSTDFKDDQTFTLDFSSEDNFQNIFFSKYSDYYIATLDCYLDLPDIVNKKEHFSNLTHDKYINELSVLSRELIGKGADFQNDIQEITLKSSLDSTAKFDFKLNLTDDIIDIMSFKYDYYDTVDKVQKKCEIYDPFKHLVTGLKFTEKTPKKC